MCGGPDIEAECEHLDGLVLAAFEGFKDFMRVIYNIDEKKVDWIKEFLEGVGSRLTALEKEGKLSGPSTGSMT